MVFPDSDYDSSALSVSGGKYTFSHSAYGADKFRYSANFGKNWTDWAAYEQTSTLNATMFSDSGNFWDGEHVMVQCACILLLNCDGQLTLFCRLERYREVCVRRRSLGQWI